MIKKISNIKKYILIIFIIFTSSAIYLTKVRPGNKTGTVTAVNQFHKESNAMIKIGNGCNRIISLAPSITETLFELGLGERVVGVTNFCDYPPEAKAIGKIGGYYDTSYESILMLDPDLIIMLIEHETQKKNLEGFVKNLLIVDQRDISGIIESIMTIGTTCGKKYQAEHIIDYINDRIGYIREKTRDLPRPKVMICVGRAIGSGALKDVYICGEKGFYNEMINLAGGVNVCLNNTTIQYPAITGEGITRLDPEVIIELIPDIKKLGLDKKTIAKEWEVLQDVDAVKNQRIYIIGQDYVAIPGPRFILTLEDIAKSIHPEIIW